jgi:hypothetical protein
MAEQAAALVGVSVAEAAKASAREALELSHDFDAVRYATPEWRFVGLCFPNLFLYDALLKDFILYSSVLTFFACSCVCSPPTPMLLFFCSLLYACVSVFFVCLCVFATKINRYTFLHAAPMLTPLMTYALQRRVEKPKPPTVTTINRFLRHIFAQARLNPECSIICLIYVERLMQKTSLSLLYR